MKNLPNQGPNEENIYPTLQGSSENAINLKVPFLVGDSYVIVPKVRWSILGVSNLMDSCTVILMEETHINL